MNKYYIILFLLLFENKSFAQHLQENKPFKKPLFLLAPVAKNAQKTIRENHSSSFIPNFYCYEKLAFFCKLEVKTEQKAKMPIKFRLGDVHYVDYLEQKNTAIFKD